MGKNDSIVWLYDALYGDPTDVYDWITFKLLLEIPVVLLTVLHFFLLNEVLSARLSQSPCGLIALQYLVSNVRKGNF